jgi:hypothetical protein
MRIGGPFGLGALEPVAVERAAAQPAAGVSSQNLEDPITLSSTARAREAAAMHPRFGEFSAAAHRDADFADQMAYNYGHIDVHQAVDASRWDEEGFLRYSATGEPVTPESEARFNEYAHSYKAASLALYSEERAKGTSSADIFDKLIALGDSQPAEFRAMMNWELRNVE